MRTKKRSGENEDQISLPQSMFQCQSLPLLFFQDVTPLWVFAHRLITHQAFKFLSLTVDTISRELLSVLPKLLHALFILFFRIILEAIPKTIWEVKKKTQLQVPQKMGLVMAFFFHYHILISFAMSTPFSFFLDHPTNIISPIKFSIGSKRQIKIKKKQY